MNQENLIPVVNSFNEWDPLEEVIVGRADFACVPDWHITLEATIPPQHWNWFKQNAGKPFPKELLLAVNQELDNLSAILEAEGVVVRRPDPVDWSQSYNTPDFNTVRGLYGAMPRDFLLVIGNELIEAPMAWRSRYFEFRAYRSLIKEYFRQGAQWTAAPKPQMSDDLYKEDLSNEGISQEATVLTEFEPVFDAAEFSRCGKDIFCQVSQVTNRFGIEWLQRHLGDNYQVHILDFNDPHAMHIDSTFVPLAPGKLLINPTRSLGLPSLFKSWDILTPPESSTPDSHPLYFSSKWISMNLLSLDEERVLVEKQEEPTIKFLKDSGFKPIPVPLRNFGSLGGSFHCATCDIRRRGKLESYF